MRESIKIELNFYESVSRLYIHLKKKKQFHGKSQILAIGVQKGFEWSSRNLPARLSFQAALLVSNA